LIGAVIFLIVFVLFVLIGFAGIVLPPGDWIVQQYIPDLLQTDYAHIAEGIINGVIFGIIIWIAFSIAMMIYEKLRGPKEIKVKIEPTTTPVLSQPISSKIIEIEGIGSTYAKKLNTHGIKTTDDLLETGGTKQGRKELADKTGISETVILEWVNMADLFRIKGIGEEYSDLLKEAGVSTVVELARRNPENLHETILGYNEAKKLVRRPPSLTQIIDWIEQAKILPRKVEY
jgi:predicted flap endonuclease-1-like 5' DNA nuclease